MLHEDRWAAAFTGALGANAAEGLLCLKSLVPPVKEIPGALFGYALARQLEKILRESVGVIYTAESGVNHVTEYAIRFITLAVEKNVFEKIDVILAAIEKKIDADKGVLAVIVESAAPVDNVFEEELRRQILELTGASSVKLQARLSPDLLGGYKLRIGGLYVDASLKGQIERMKTDLEAALASQGGGMYG